MANELLARRERGAANGERCTGAATAGRLSPGLSLGLCISISINFGLSISRIRPAAGNSVRRRTHLSARLRRYIGGVSRAPCERPHRLRFERTDCNCETERTASSQLID